MQIETEDQSAWEEDPLPDNLASLLDGVFLTSVPAAARMLELLEERGWSGWRKLRPVAP